MPLRQSPALLRAPPRLGRRSGPPRRWPGWLRGASGPPSPSRLRDKPGAVEPISLSGFLACLVFPPCDTPPCKWRYRFAPLSFPRRAAAANGDVAARASERGCESLTSGANFPVGRLPTHHFWRNSSRFSARDAQNPHRRLSQGLKSHVAQRAVGVHGRDSCRPRAPAERGDHARGPHIGAMYGFNTKVRGVGAARDPRSGCNR